MPFTSTTDYFGVVAVILGLLGIVLAWKRPEVKILTGFMIFSLLLAFGRHFPLIYQVFFKWMPFFDKFRIPTMIVVMVMFSNALLAGFGLQALLEKVKENDLKKVMRQVLPIFGIIILLGVIPLLLRNVLGFIRADESKSYSPEIISLLKAVRFDLLKSDALRMLALTAAAFGLVFSYLKYNLPRALFVGAMMVLLLLDLLPINKRYMQQLIPKQQMEDYFSVSRADQFMQADKEPHRVFPLGELSSEAHWSYFHQSIEGYHPAKLRIYQDIRESCLYEGKESGFSNAQAPINWNIVNMLNVKYLISQQEVQHPDLVPVFQDQEQQLLVYKNNRVLPRAFCIGRIEVISDRQMRLQRLNQFSFKSDSVAILEKPLSGAIETPQQWSTKVTRYEPNLIDLEVSSDKPALLVLSEIYYPAGWSAVVNGVDAEIYKVNHILRGVRIPAGESTIRFKLAPRSFQISLMLMSISMTIIYGLLIAAFFLAWRQVYRSSIKTA
ncbi:MAG: hypothetical protein EHM72_03135 [Calditrichaeota bacterium]|nr:MAG: hypothetical protein EHM72_03135 [Calditrichota bacterium]